jgi:branched-chain amino acid transport system permease protein
MRLANLLWMRASAFGSLPAVILVLLMSGVTAIIGNRVLVIITSHLLIMVILTLGNQIFTGNSGVISYGHVGFMAVGAYVSAVFTVPPAIKESFLWGLPRFIASSQLDFIPAMLIALCIGFILAFIIGVPMVRISSLEAGGPIVTFAFLVVVEVVLSGWQGVTGGRRALYGVPTHANLAWITGMTVLALVLARLYRDSPLGLKLRASREDDVAARAMGVNLERVRLGSWVLSAVIATLSGVLLGHFLGVFSPTQFWLATTVNGLAMLIVGGMTTASGSVLGVVLITVVLEVARSIETWTGQTDTVPDLFGLAQMAVAVLFLIVLYLKSDGLTGRWELDEHLRTWWQDRNKTST